MTDAYGRPPPLPPPPMSGAQAHTKRLPADPAMIEKLSKGVNSIAANLKIMEERYSLMRNKSQLSEQNMIEMEKSMTKDIKALNDEFTDLKHEINDIMDKLRLISEELKNLVDKDDFKVLEKYVDMWQPMGFVTRNELMKMIQEKKAEKDNSKP